MLAVARALLTNPRLVLLDEPSEGLAPRSSSRSPRWCATMRAEGVAVLLVEQDLHLAFAVADEIAVLEEGRSCTGCRPAQFRRDPATAHRLLGLDPDRCGAALPSGLTMDAVLGSVCACRWTIGPRGNRRSGSPRCSSEAAQHLDRAQSVISEIVDGLQRKDLLEREPIRPTGDAPWSGSPRPRRRRCDGTLQSFDERFDRMIGWQARRHPEQSREQLESATLEYMATMPAWREHPRVARHG